MKKTILQKMNVSCLVSGDFKTNVLVTRNNILVDALHNFECAFSLKQLIEEPTRVRSRVCTNSESAIDLILVSDHEKVCQSGVLSVGISDSMFTYCTRQVTRCQWNKHNTVQIRSSKHNSKERFIHLNDMDWSDVLGCNNIDMAWNSFKAKFLSVLDKLAPYKEVRSKQITHPWMPSEIFNLISQRDKYLGKFRNKK